MQETNAVYFERPLIISVKPRQKAGAKSMVMGSDANGNWISRCVATAGQDTGASETQQ